MRFNDHSKIRGSHAFLSASKYHWVNYTEEKLVTTFKNTEAAARGTKLHEYAMMAINLNIRQARTQNALNMYINDAIGFGMTTEQTLFYSMNAYGTADTIHFREASRGQRGKLRIHDYKSGVSRVSMTQLYIYAAFFCLEYNVVPTSIDFEFRIYQNSNVLVEVGDLESPEVAETVAMIMDKVVEFDKMINSMREGALL